jgi:hypothetical protein
MAASCVGIHPARRHVLGTGHLQRTPSCCCAESAQVRFCQLQQCAAGLLPKLLWPFAKHKYIREVRAVDCCNVRPGLLAKLRWPFRQRQVHQGSKICQLQQCAAGPTSQAAVALPPKDKCIREVRSANCSNVRPDLLLKLQWRFPQTQVHQGSKIRQLQSCAAGPTSQAAVALPPNTSASGKTHLVLMCELQAGVCHIELLPCQGLKRLQRALRISRKDGGIAGALVLDANEKAIATGQICLQEGGCPRGQSQGSLQLCVLNNSHRVRNRGAHLRGTSASTHPTL